MKNRRRQFGFSLIEVLMAVGILAVGLLLVAGTFPVGIHLTAVSTERTLGAVAADEAFAKIQLYGVGAVSVYCEDFNDVLSSGSISHSEYLYPSDPNNDNRVYVWSAVCRSLGDDSVQVTVFVNRKVSQGLNYHNRNAGSYYPGATSHIVPLPLILDFSSVNNGREIEVSTTSYSSGLGFSDYITDDSVIVDDETGNIYRIIDLDIENNIFYTDRDWLGAATGSFWVVPPPVGGGKSPCVGVYQRIINF